MSGILFFTKHSCLGMPEVKPQFSKIPKYPTIQNFLQVLCRKHRKFRYSSGRGFKGQCTVYTYRKNSVDAAQFAFLFLISRCELMGTFGIGIVCRTFNSNFMSSTSMQLDFYTTALKKQFKEGVSKIEFGSFVAVIEPHWVCIFLCPAWSPRSHQLRNLFGQKKFPKILAIWVVNTISRLDKCCFFYTFFNFHF